MSKALSKLLFVLSADIREFQTEFRKAEKDLKKMGTAMQKVGKDMSTYLTAPIAGLGTGAYIAFRGMNEAMKQVEAGLLSTGGTVGYTAEELKKMSTEMGRVTNNLNTDILKDVTAQLLTFTNITDESFSKAQMAVMDISARMGTDLKSAALQVGKALNDPVAGITALTRSGIQFTDQQKELIRTMVETGDVVGAQTIILAELETQFGGSAAAAGDSADRIKNSFVMLGQSFGAIIADYINPLFDRISDMIDNLDGMGEAKKRLIVIVGALVAAVGPMLIALGFFVKTIVPMMITGLRAVLIGYSKVTAGMIAMTKASTYQAIALKAKVIALKVATAAMRVFNAVMAMNPLGLVLTALVAVTAAFMDFRRIARQATAEAWSDSTRNAIEEDKKELEFLSKRFQEHGQTVEEAQLRAAQAMRNSINASYEATAANREMREEEKSMHKERIAELDTIIMALELEKQQTVALTASVSDFSQEVAQPADDNVFENLLADVDNLSTGVDGVMDEITSDVEDFNDAVAQAPVGLIGQLRDEINSLNDQKQIAGTQEEIANLNVELADLYEKLKNLENVGLEEPLSKTINLSTQLSDSLKEMATNAVVAFAEVAGSGMKGMSAVGHMLGGIISTAENLGKLAISIGIATLGIRKALESLNPVAAIAAGAALIALASFAKGAMSNMVPKMKDGGIVPSGFPNDTYPALLTSGERVVPPGKLDHIGGGNMLVDVTVKGVTKGMDLVYMVERVTTHRKKVIGR